MKILSRLSEERIKKLFETFNKNKIEDVFYTDINKEVKEKVLVDYMNADNKQFFYKYQLLKSYKKHLSQTFKEKTGRDYYTIEYQELFDFDDFIEKFNI